MVLHEFFAYLSIVFMVIYTYWGYTLFNQLGKKEQKWKYPWLVGMIVTIGIFAIFWGTM